MKILPPTEYRCKTCNWVFIKALDPTQLLSIRYYQDIKSFVAYLIFKCQRCRMTLAVEEYGFSEKGKEHDTIHTSYQESQD